MAFVPGLLRGAGSFAIATGVADAFIGSRMLEGLAGEPFSITSPVGAVADSQIRFLGSTWAGFGAMLWWVSNDVPARRTPLAILLGAFFLGGIGRSLSILAHGNATPLFISFIGIELIGPPAIWLALGGTGAQIKNQ